MLKKGEGFAKGGMTDDDFPSDDQEKLAAEHIKEAKRGKAKITNMGWGSGPDFIESKTDKGILYSDIEDGKVSHEWEYDDEEYAKGGVTKPRLKKGDKVEIYGKRWFQKSYGNTYHVTKVYVNGVDIGESDQQYGYDEQYLQTGAKILWNKYNPPYKWNMNNPLWMLRNYGIDIYYSVFK